MTLRGLLRSYKIELIWLTGAVTIDIILQRNARPEGQVSPKI